MYKALNILTIAFPVYKRPELFRGALESAIACKDERLSILICDDSRDAVNREVYENLAGSDDRVEYHSNSKNLGIDANIKQCADLAEGRYVWIIGEDDRVCVDVITSVIDLLEASGPDFAIANYVYCSNDYKSNIGPPLFGSEWAVSRSELIKSYYKLGFIGSIIFYKKLWMEFTGATPVGTFFHHLGVLGKIAFCRDGFRAEYIPQVCVRNRAEDGNSATWVKQALNVHFGYYEAAKSFLHRLTPMEKKLFYKSSRSLFRPEDPLWLLSKRADGGYNLLAYNMWFRSKSTVNKGIYYFIAVFPPGLARLIKAVYLKTLRGKGKLS